jgi:hypothetical protein
MLCERRYSPGLTQTLRYRDLRLGLPALRNPEHTARFCNLIVSRRERGARRTEICMPKEKLTPQGEVIAAQGAAMVAAFQVLINCLEESDALLPGQFPEALYVYMEMVKSRTGDVSDMTLAMLHDIRTATLD